MALSVNWTGNKDNGISGSLDRPKLLYTCSSVSVTRETLPPILNHTKPYKAVLQGSVFCMTKHGGFCPAVFHRSLKPPRSVACLCHTQLLFKHYDVIQTRTELQKKDLHKTLLTFFFVTIPV